MDTIYKQSAFIKHSTLTFKKNILAFAGIAFFILSMAACMKPDLIRSDHEGNIYMPRAYGSQAQLSLLLLDTAQPVVFGAAYGGLEVPGKDITVSFIVDSGAVASYNAWQGTSYTLLPAASYRIPSLNGVIKAGQTGSSVLQIQVETKNLDPFTPYMLPVTLSNASGGTVDSSLKTAYFRFEHLDNIYAGNYHTTGTRTNYQMDGTPAGTSQIDDTRPLTTVGPATCDIGTIANLGVNAGTLFRLTVNPDKTVSFSGYLSAPGQPIQNAPNSTSTYDPVNKTFTVHYMYTKTNGDYRIMDEVWTKNL